MRTINEVNNQFIYDLLYDELDKYVFKYLNELIEINATNEILTLLDLIKKLNDDETVNTDNLNKYFDIDIINSLLCRNSKGDDLSDKLIIDKLYDIGLLKHVCNNKLNKCFLMYHTKCKYKISVLYKLLGPNCLSNQVKAKSVDMFYNDKEMMDLFDEEYVHDIIVDTIFNSTWVYSRLKDHVSIPDIFKAGLIMNDTTLLMLVELDLSKINRLSLYVKNFDIILEKCTKSDILNKLPLSYRVRALPYIIRNKLKDL